MASSVGGRRWRAGDPSAPAMLIRNSAWRCQYDSVDAGRVLSFPRFHGHRDATTVILPRHAQVGRSYWDWSMQEWAEVIDEDQAGFRRSPPARADDAVRSRPFAVPGLVLVRGCLAQSTLSFPALRELGSFPRSPAERPRTIERVRCYLFGHPHRRRGRLRCPKQLHGLVYACIGDRCRCDRTEQRSDCGDDRWGVPTMVGRRAARRARTDSRLRQKSLGSAVGLPVWTELGLRGSP